MQIQFKCSCGEESCREWAIIELQGLVELQHHSPLQIQIGRLCRPSKDQDQDTYTFTVGYHELTGSKLPLKKPLLVLKKIKPTGVTDVDADADAQLQVIGIIRHRILFKTRPKALISRPQPAAKERSKAP